MLILATVFRFDVTRTYAVEWDDEDGSNDSDPWTTQYATYTRGTQCLPKQTHVVLFVVTTQRAGSTASRENNETKMLH